MSNATFASVLERGLGRTICREFYFPYARKIWGVDPTELDAEQARKRVSAGSMRGMLRKVLNAVPGLKAPGAGRFFYPRQGYGQISEAYSAAAQHAGATVKLATTVTGLHIDRGRAVGITVSNGSSGMLPVRQLFSTVPLPLLCRMATPSAPSDVVTAATQLRYRGMILVYLVLALAPVHRIRRPLLSRVGYPDHPAIRAEELRAGRPRRDDRALCRTAVRNRRARLVDDR